jgi:hypothetical protein
LRTFILTLVIFCAGSYPWQSRAQAPVNDNSTYKPFIKTILFHKTGFEMSSPVITLNSKESLELSFDDLDSDLKRYRYTIYHCESDWTTSSGLTESDFIDGIREVNIDRFAYSTNTTVPYTHYSAKFPDGGLNPKISGNYILKVYIDDPSELAFTRRFMVVEPSPVTVTSEVHQATNVSDKFSKQEVDFEILLNGMRVADPTREIKVVVTQNDRWDNAIHNLKPRFVRGEVLDYNYDEENNFNGGNEFRSFDTKSLKYQSERIDRIIYDTGGYRVYLLDDMKRTTKNYVTDKDINGRKIIKNEDNAVNSDLEADYAWVIFTLPIPSPVSSGQIYLLGALTDWQFDETSRMNYNLYNKTYQKALYLKQGFYNYIYVLKDIRTSRADEAFIEGSHWETENEYTILVYFHEFGGLTDRLISLQNLNSMK